MLYFLPNLPQFHKPSSGTWFLDSPYFWESAEAVALQFGHIMALVLLWVEPWLDICPPCQRYDSMKFCANFCKFGTSLIGSKLNNAFSKPFKIYDLLFN